MLDNVVPLCDCGFVFCTSIFFCMLWGIFLIYRHVPYHFVFCETYKISTTDCPCVINDGFICNSQGNFLDNVVPRISTQISRCRDYFN
jgi:hypothetical protein